MSRETTHPLSVGDHGEQIPFIPVIHHDVEVVPFLDEPVHGDDARVGRGETVQGDLPSLEMSLSGVEAVSTETFHRAVGRLTVPRVYGQVDDSVRAGAYDRDQVDVARVNVPG